MLSNLRATAVYPLPLGLPALATLLGACALVVDVEDCRTDAVCGQGRVCVDGTCLTVAPSPSEAGAGGALPTDEDAGRPGLAAPPLPEGCDERLLVGGAPYQRRSGDIVVYKSVGIGLEDVALAQLALERCS